jgi:hypothetical protein
MEVIRDTAAGYERIKMYMITGVCVIFGLIMFTCGITTMFSSQTSSTKSKDTTQKVDDWGDPIPASAPVQGSTNPMAGVWCSLFSVICFIIAYGSYYIASNKSLENGLAAQGAVNATHAVVDAFNNHNGGLFNIGE